MAVLDFLKDLFSGEKEVTAGDVVRELKRQYPHYAQVDDARLATAAAKKDPKKFGFLASYDPAAPVPPEYVPPSLRTEAFYQRHQDIGTRDALRTIEAVKARYPKFRNVGARKLAAALEKKYPEKFTGLSARLGEAPNIEPEAPNIPAKPAPRTVPELQAALVERTRARDAARVAGPEVPIITDSLQQPSQAQARLDARGRLEGPSRLEQAETAEAGEDLRAFQAEGRKTLKKGARKAFLPLPDERVARAYAAGVLGTAADLAGAIPFAENAMRVRSPVGQAADAVSMELDKAVSVIGPNDPNFLDHLIMGAGSMTMFMIPGGLTAAGTSRMASLGNLASKVAPHVGAATATVLEAATEAGGVFKDLVKQGRDPIEAAQNAKANFFGNLALIYATNKLGIFGDFFQNKPARMAAASTMEGLQEVGQSIFQDIAEERAVDERNAAIAGAVGVILGGGAGFVASEIDGQPPAAAPAAEPPIASPGKPKGKAKPKAAAADGGYWRVGGALGEDRRAGEVGQFLRYEDDMVRVRFPDGSEDLFTPHQLFPAEAPKPTPKAKKGKTLKDAAFPEGTERERAPEKFQEEANPESAYAGDNLQALMETAEQEQAGRFRAISDLEEAAKTAKGPKLKKLTDEAAELRQLYEGTFSEVTDAGGDADAMRSRVEGQAEQGGSDTIEAGLKRSLHSIEGTEQRWKKARKRGLTDDELKKVIGYEFGTFGGKSGPGQTSVSFQGGANPKFWYGARHNQKPTLSGRALLKKVREIMDIPYPPEKSVVEPEVVLPVPRQAEPTEDESPAMAAPPKGWTADRGSMPGEPAYYLGKDLDAARAVIIEREIPGGKVVYDAVGMEGDEPVKLGQFSTVDEAAKAGSAFAGGAKPIPEEDIPGPLPKSRRLEKQGPAAEWEAAQPSERRERLAAARAALEKTPPTKERFTGEDGAYLPKRKAFHDMIVEDPRYNKPEALVPEGQQPTVDIVMGPPGAGKTSAIQAILGQEAIDKAILIDNDDVKEMLPGWDRKLAGAFQEEASDITDRLYERVFERRNNVILSIVGRNQAALRELISEVKKRGFKVNLRLMDLEPEKAVVRAVERFERGGRFVDPVYVLEGVGLNPQQNYDKLKEEADSYERYYTDVPRGSAPRLIEHGVGKPGGEVRPAVPGGVRPGGAGAPERAPKGQRTPEAGAVRAEPGQDAESAPEGGVDEPPSPAEPAPEPGPGPGAPEGRGGVPAGGRRPRRGAAPGGSESVQPAPERRGDQPNPGQRRRGARGQRNQAVEKAARQAAKPTNHNYRITDADEIGAGGPKAKFKANLEAIRTLKAIEAEQRKATPEEQAVLVKYVGWGGIPQAFEGPEGWVKEAAALKEILTGDEYAAARRSIINAHYTSPEVIRFMWEAAARLGVTGGRALEPAAGVGHFLGLAPTGLDLSFTGVELDSLTGRIAKQLYQAAEIHVQGFQDLIVPKDFYDLAISNVPFANIKPFDPRAKDLGIPKGLSLHDFFFAKALATVRPGGLVAFITSRFTMDQQDSKFRRWMAKQADLVAAFRLPFDAFKANAGAEVVTDVLFLRKRLSGEVPADVAWMDVVAVGPSDDPRHMNRYFQDNPKNVLGQIEVQGGHYMKDLVVKADRPLPEMLAEALERLPKSILGEPADAAAAAPAVPDRVSAADFKDALPFTYLVKDGKIYQKVTDTELEERDFGGDTLRMAQMLEVRDALLDHVAAQIRGADDAAFRASARRLNQVYDDFVEEYGFLNAKKNEDLIWEDPYAARLAALEVDKGDGTYAKAPIFTERTVMPHVKPVKAKDAREAVTVSLAEYGHLNWDYMAQIAGKGAEALQDELAAAGRIYKDPEGQKWVLDEEYLSGNVKRKLTLAEAAAKEDPAYEANAAALRKVIPADIPFNKISVKFGMAWIDPETVREFLAQVLDVSPYYVRVEHNPVAGKWNITMNTYSPKNTTEMGTPHWPAHELVQALSNMEQIVVKDKVQVGDSETTVLNEEQTALAQDKAEILKKRFVDWFWEDDARREHYLRHYNDTMNTSVERKYDGSHLTLPGLSSVFKLRSSQRNAVWRAITSKAVLLGHDVGAGKTVTMIAAVMESKRLGLIHKPLVVVPNNTLPGWKSEWNRAYPGANILIADERNFSKDKRKRFLATISNGNWDAVVMGLNAAEKIGVSKETFKAYVDAKLDDLRAAKEKARGEGSRITAKQIEKAIEALEERLKAKLDQTVKDEGLIFEETGIDSVLVDEADLFKNLSYQTKMQNVKGLGAQAGNKRTDDLLMKLQVVRHRGGKMIFASGTPVSNTMAEVHSMMRYLQPELLAERGLEHFDDWANTFGEVMTSLEVDVAGRYKSTSRFSRFVNVPELLQMIRQVWDIQTRQDLEDQGVIVRGRDKPFIRGGKMQVVQSPAIPELKNYIRGLQERADALKGRKVEKGGDNLLVILQDGIKASLDLRLVDPHAPADPNSKLEVAIQDVIDHYHKYKNGETMVIFLDRPAPDEKADFNPQVYFKRRLIKAGIPANQIAFVQDFDTLEKKERLFKDMNEGRKRILFGSTEKLGAGTNIQRKLGYLLHLDIPMRPRDITQRNGRIDRAGNTNKEVDIRIMVAKGSFDTFMFQMVEAKDKAISQIMAGKGDVRVLEEETNEYEILKSVATDNPLVKEKVTIDAEVKKLAALRSAYQQQKFAARDSLKGLPEKFRQAEAALAAAQADVAARAPKPKDFAITIQGKTYTDKNPAWARLVAIANEALENRREEVEVGQYNGFDLSVRAQLGMQGTTKELILRKNAAYFGKLTETAAGTFASLDNALYAGPEDRIRAMEGALDRARKTEASSRELADKPFEREDEYQAKLARQAEVNRLLKKEAEGKSQDAVGNEVPPADPAQEDAEDRREIGVPDEEPPAAAPTTALSGGFLPGEAVEFLGRPVVKAYNATHDFIWRFGKQKRMDPELFDKLMSTSGRIAARVSKAISIVNERVRGRQLTLDERVLVGFGVEEKSFDLPEHLHPMRDAIIELFEEINQTNVAMGIYKQPFLERVEAERVQEAEQAREAIQTYRELPDVDEVKAAAAQKIEKLERRLAEIEEELEQIRDLRWVSHRVVVQAIIDQKMAALGEDQRKVWLSNARRISFKYKGRKGITPLRVLYQEGLIQREDLDVVRISMAVTSEAFFRWTMKDLFDFARARGYIVGKTKKGVPANWETLNPLRHGIVAPEYENYRIHPLFGEALQELKDSLTHTTNPLKYVLSVVKMGQFIQPSIIWKYNVLQMAFGGALGVKTPKHLARAVRQVLEYKITGIEPADYAEANDLNTFQKAYLPVVGSKSEAQAIELAATKTLADYGVFRKIFESIIDVKVTPANWKELLVSVYRAIGQLTWLGDESMRLAAYMSYKDQGFTKEQAAKMAAEWMGAYHDISKRSSDLSSYIFFVYAFRFLMPRQIFHLIYDPVRMTLDSIKYGASGGRQGRAYAGREWWRAAKGLSALLFAMFAVDYWMKRKGFTSKSHMAIPFYSWVKEVTDAQGKKHQMVVRLDLIYNQPIKWLSRLLSYDPTDPRPPFLQGLIKFAKWELNPLYRIIFYDLMQNRKSIGQGRVYDPSADPWTRRAQITEYVLKESFRVLRVGEKEPEQTQEYRLEQKDKERMMDAAIGRLERVLLGQFGNIFVAAKERQYYDWAIRRARKERMSRYYWAKGLPRDRRRRAVRDIDLWYRKVEDFLKRNYHEGRPPAPRTPIPEGAT